MDIWEVQLMFGQWIFRESSDNEYLGKMYNEYLESIELNVYGKSNIMKKKNVMQSESNSKV